MKYNIRRAMMDELNNGGIYDTHRTNKTSYGSNDTGRLR